MDYQAEYLKLKKQCETYEAVLIEFSKLIDHKLFVNKGSYIYGYYRELLSKIGIESEDKK